METNRAKSLTKSKISRTMPSFWVGFILRMVLLHVGGKVDVILRKVRLNVGGNSNKEILEVFSTLSNLKIQMI